MHPVLSGKVGLILANVAAFDAHTDPKTLAVYCVGGAVLKFPLDGDKAGRGLDLLARLQQAFGGNQAPSAAQP